jgi:hypothetical protein
MLSDELLQLGPKIGNLSSYMVLHTTKPFKGVALDDLVGLHPRSVRRSAEGEAGDEADRVGRSS